MVWFRYVIPSWHSNWTLWECSSVLVCHGFVVRTFGIEPKLHWTIQVGMVLNIHFSYSVSASALEDHAGLRLHGTWSLLNRRNSGLRPAPGGRLPPLRVHASSPARLSGPTSSQRQQALCPRSSWPLLPPPPPWAALPSPLPPAPEHVPSCQGVRVEEFNLLPPLPEARHLRATHVQLPGQGS